MCRLSKRKGNGDSMNSNQKTSTGMRIVIIILIIIIIFFVFSIARSCGRINSYKGSSSGSTGDKDTYGHDKFDAFVIAKNIVNSNLKSPSTAKFCSTSDATITRSGNTWTVRGWVDAQNS